MFWTKPTGPPSMNTNRKVTQHCPPIIGKKRRQGGDPKIKWKILEQNIPTYNPVTKICKLCLREKFNIVMKPSLATLNSRQEIFGHCRHKLPKLIGKPPDWKWKWKFILFILFNLSQVMYEPLFPHLYFHMSLYACLRIGVHVSISVKLLVTELKSKFTN